MQIYDYVDRKVPILARMFDKRVRGYRAMGYNLSEGSILEKDGNSGRVKETDKDTIDIFRDSGMRREDDQI